MGIHVIIELCKTLAQPKSSAKYRGQNYALVASAEC